jgi:hypothetical protein
MLSRVAISARCATACDRSGYGEGETHLGATTVFTDPFGNGAFSAKFPLNPSTPTPIRHRDRPVRQHVGVLGLRDGRVAPCLTTTFARRELRGAQRSTVLVQIDPIACVGTVPGAPVGRRVVPRLRR